MRGAWSRPLAGLSPAPSAALWAASFIVPRAGWCAVSYVPFVWHPMVRVTDPGDVTWMTRDLLVERAAFAAENAEVAARSGRPAVGAPANPVFLPAPHAVVRALVTGFTHAARPARRAVAAPEPVAQHPGDLLGLPALVDHRRAAGHPVRRAAGDGPADRTVHRVLPLPARARVRRAGGRGAGHRGRAQGRDHLHRDVLPAGAGHRQHHAPHRSRAARGGGDAGRHRAAC